MGADRIAPDTDWRLGLDAVGILVPNNGDLRHCVHPLPRHRGSTRPVHIHLRRRSTLEVVGDSHSDWRTYYWSAS